MDTNDNCDDDEAALIDSFFLPGGLFSDYEDKKHGDDETSNHFDDNSSNNDGRREGNPVEHSRIPSNPWQSDPSTIAEGFVLQKMEATVHLPGTMLQINNDESRDFSTVVPLRQTRLDEQQQQQASSTTTCRPIIKNPNFSYLQSSFTGQQQDQEFSIHSSNTLMMGQKLLFSESQQQQQQQYHVAPEKSVYNSGFVQGCDNNNNITFNKVVQPPPGFRSTSEGIPYCPKSQAATTSNYQSYFEESRMEAVTPDVSEGSHKQLEKERHEARAILEEEQSASSKEVEYYEEIPSRFDANGHDFEEEEDDDDQTAKDDEDEEEDEGDGEEDDASIPIDIFELTRTESNTCSSLSTSSDFDNSDDDASGTAHVDHARSGDYGYDTDQAHVSQIAAIEQSNDGRSASTAPSAVYPGEQMLSSSPNPRRSTRQRNGGTSLLRSMWSYFVSVLLLFVYLPVNFPRFLYNTTCNQLQQSVFLASIFNRAKRIRQQSADRIGAVAQSVSIYFLKVRNVTRSRVLRVVKVTILFLAFAAKVLLFTVHILLQTWRFASFEAMEELDVSKGYAIFYFMPGFCFFLMKHVNLPHWTPHLLTWVGLFSLCHHFEPGPLLQDESMLYHHAVTQFSFSSALEKRKADDDQDDATASTTPSSRVNTKNQRSPRKQRRIPRDERACRTILKILRFVLPVFFVADGFSSEFGTIMGVSGASRLTTAFMMSLVRKNLVSSPIGWSSWAFQVVAATYFAQWRMVLDFLVGIVGLASIRLIRYLDGERAKRRQQWRV